MSADKSQLKKEILAAGIERHETVMKDFRTRIRQLMSTDGNVNEEEYDSHVQSQKAEAATEASLLSDQLEFAAHELDELRKLEWDIEDEHSTVAFGTVVVTDRETFFVSASIERFFVNDNPVFGLSVQSPLYNSMRGKTVGDSFGYKDRRYVIKEIF